MENEMSDDIKYKLRLAGKGLTLDQAVSIDVAQRIVSLVLGAEASKQPADEVPAGAQFAGYRPAPSASNPKQFMAEKKPASDVERVTCLAYFLTHFRDTPQFKTKDLTALNREAAQPGFSNMTVAARNATQQDYLALAGGGRKLITSRGEAVVQALPDRDKVRAALNANSTPRRRKKRKKTMVTARNV
jgi:hypothetical protein